jgi:hypothetical protein
MCCSREDAPAAVWLILCELLIWELRSQTSGSGIDKSMATYFCLLEDRGDTPLWIEALPRPGDGSALWWLPCRELIWIGMVSHSYIFWFLRLISWLLIMISYWRALYVSTRSSMPPLNSTSSRDFCKPVYSLKLLFYLLGWIFKLRPRTLAWLANDNSNWPADSGLRFPYLSKATCCTIVCSSLASWTTT